MNYSPDFTMPIWIRKRIRKRCREKWSQSKREYRALPMDLRRVLFQNILQSPWCGMKRKRMRENEIFRFSRSPFLYGLEFQKMEGERIIYKYTEVETSMVSASWKKFCFAGLEVENPFHRLKEWGVVKGGLMMCLFI